MDATVCKEPYFQWDDKTHSCMGCIENANLHDKCKSCDDYKGNIEKK